MNAIEIARRMAELGQKKDAVTAYTLVLQDKGAAPAERLESAVYILQAGGDHRVSVATFKELYNAGHFRDQIRQIMTSGFYKPNIKTFRNRYERNCKLLARYPYFSRKDFLPFEELPVRFFPYDDNGFLPFNEKEDRFGEYVNFDYPEITHHFFKDLEQPVRGDDIYSMYELKYLRDNVRKSELVGRENHIYLCYYDWGTFCAYLQCLNFRGLLEDKKFVFLFEGEIAQYPIDFKEKYGIDYSQFSVKPIDITEVNRLIWHIQFSTHNGGDFFNEIFDAHPNLIVVPSIWMTDVDQLTAEMEKTVAEGRNCVTWEPADGDREKLVKVIGMLKRLKKRTKKDLFVASFMYISDLRCLDQASRIVPAVFFQPHFPNIHYSIGSTPDGRAIAFSPEYDQIHRSSMFNGFPYIKTFSLVRRFTTSYGAATRRSNEISMEIPEDGELPHVVGNLMMQRILNRGYLIDPEIRMYKDCRIVRFEDGKLNPKATFTAMAAFLDLPYTKSMTYCSMNGELDPMEFENSARGFDTAPVYRSYEEYSSPDERYFLEYFLSEAYTYFEYDFHYYDGKPVDLGRAKELIKGFTVLSKFVFESRVAAGIWNSKGRRRDNVIDEEAVKEKMEQKAKNVLKEYNEEWVDCAEVLLRNLRFQNMKGQPLRFMPKLELDPALLEQPIYH